jgi:multidrug efflux pump subunit AcrB
LLGLLVDDAIIAIEMMVVKMEEGYDRIKASAYAWSHTAAPMLAGTLVTAIGFMPNGFAQSTAGEYTSNMFWIVGLALIASWLVAVVFTPYLGVKMLPDIAKWKAAMPPSMTRRAITAFAVCWPALSPANGAWPVPSSLFVLAVLGMGLVKKQFFPTSDRPEVLVEVQMPYGTSIEQTSAATAKIEAWLQKQPEAKLLPPTLARAHRAFIWRWPPNYPTRRLPK